MARGLGRLANEIDLLLGILRRAPTIVTHSNAFSDLYQTMGRHKWNRFKFRPDYFEGHPDYNPRGLRSDARLRTNIPGTRHMVTSPSPRPLAPLIQANFDEAANPSRMDWDDERHSEYGGGHERDFSPAPYFPDRTSHMPIAPDYIATAERLSLTDLRQVVSFEPATCGQSKQETYKQHEIALEPHWFRVQTERIKRISRFALGQKRKRGGGSARVLKEYRTRIQAFDNILVRIFTVPIDIAAEHGESHLFREILSPLYQECQRPLPEDEIMTDEDQEGSDRLLRWIQKAYRPFLGKRVPDEYWDQLESEHHTWQAAPRPFATTVLVHIPKPPKPPTNADLEPERKKIWDSWIVECAHRWLALSSKPRDVYRWMRKKGSGGGGAAVGVLEMRVRNGAFVGNLFRSARLYACLASQPLSLQLTDGWITRTSVSYLIASVLPQGTDPHAEKTQHTSNLSGTLPLAGARLNLSR
ncbi:BQ5605_C006g03908 [Microbotryum silenes-dioicae]|uniref:BQ5605_C006g03908 protein n=1 Tax=Microbotryum silenes-dioicae TaxID=796604 RepID=A0A2X0MSL2_9BASI|nr:BQ5605_C006g03908 [Microbotryum silenes-dioicae]